MKNFLLVLILIQVFCISVFAEETEISPTEYSSKTVLNTGDSVYNGDYVVENSCSAVYMAENTAEFRKVRVYRPSCSPNQAVCTYNVVCNETHSATHKVDGSPYFKKSTSYYLIQCTPNIDGTCPTVFDCKNSPSPSAYVAVDAEIKKAQNPSGNNNSNNNPAEQVTK